MKRNLILKFIVLLLNIILLPGIAKLTCIVIIKNNNQIFVGADSKRVIYYFDNTTKKFTEQSFDTYCKINKVKNIYFVIAGFDDGQTLVNAKSACNKFNTIDGVVDYFNTLTIKSHENSIEQFRTMDLNKYTQRFKDGNPVEISFFCFEKGIARVVSVNFKLQNSPQQKTKLKFFKAESDGIVFRGTYDHTPNSTNISKEDRQEYANCFDELSVIKKTIEIEAKYHPTFISAPIDILKLTAAGPIWISKKKNCQ